MVDDLVTCLSGDIALIEIGCNLKTNHQIPDMLLTRSNPLTTDEAFSYFPYFIDPIAACAPME